MLNAKYHGRYWTEKPNGFLVLTFTAFLFLPLWTSLLDPFCVNRKIVSKPTVAKHTLYLMNYHDQHNDIQMYLGQKHPLVGAGRTRHARKAAVQILKFHLCSTFSYAEHQGQSPLIINMGCDITWLTPVREMNVQVKVPGFPQETKRSVFPQSPRREMS